MCSQVFSAGRDIDQAENHVNSVVVNGIVTDTSSRGSPIGTSLIEHRSRSQFMFTNGRLS